MYSSRPRLAQLRVRAPSDMQVEPIWLRTRRVKEHAIESGSDGTRTRDLRRDRTAPGTSGKSQWPEDGLSYLS